MEVTAARREHLARWSEMRHQLWNFNSICEHAEEAAETYFVGNRDLVAFVALNSKGRAIGFAEAALRRDYVEGCESSPVAFLEGIYVDPEERKLGVARALVDAVANWGRTSGCCEFASNVLIDNTESQAFHAAVGFTETDRVIYYRKEL